jgi:hypothetical protein
MCLSRLKRPISVYLYDSFSCQVIFIVEMIMKMAAFGVLPYFMEYWHWLDALVVSTSVIEIIFAILIALSKVIPGMVISGFDGKGNEFIVPNKQVLSFPFSPTIHFALSSLYSLSNSSSYSDCANIATSEISCIPAILDSVCGVADAIA